MNSVEVTGSLVTGGDTVARLCPADDNGFSDDFFVDEILDFSNLDNFVEEENDATACCSFMAASGEDNGKGSSSEEDFESLAATELAVPVDDLASLEWLSHFVEDSNSEYAAPFPPGTPPCKKTEEKPVWEWRRLVPTCPWFSAPVPVRPRSKRPRSGFRPRHLGSPTESASSSSSSSSTITSPWLAAVLVGPEPSHGSCEKNHLPKKRKKKCTAETANCMMPRRCSHCGVQKTPQWRTGPLGAKTLCNACGVRYKSGRLLPEYRPACSPTFSSELHSNHHRKVLEMRRIKELLGGHTGSGLQVHEVQS